MLALIHWIYSCTALFGNFTSIIDYLKTSGAKTYYIEWVDPSDPAIGQLHHIDHNKKIHTEEYNRENFEKSIESIGSVTKLPRYSETRQIYKIVC